MTSRKKIEVTFQVVYDFSNREFLKEYKGWLDDDVDSFENRQWFAIDRFVGHHNLPLFDDKAILKVEEV